MAMAPGASVVQMRQPMQPVPQTFLTAGPLSLELHRTWMKAAAGTSLMSLRGQAGRHLPHAMQAALSTTASPLTTAMALTGQTRAHVP
jgi:hypothetical protein